MKNLLDPAILFFIFGAIAGTLKSNLEIPPAISRFLSLYLLMALGLKGGFALADSGLTVQVITSLGCAIFLAVLIPLIGYAVLQQYLSKFDAAAVAATYGSVSAVTFVTAVQALESQQVAFGGYMSAAMALMESPAIILAVVFANGLRQQMMPAAALPGAGAAVLAVGSHSGQPNISMRKVLHESFTDGAQLLLLGSMVVGILSGDVGKIAMQPFIGDLFKGMLAFFLLDMGLRTARSLPQIPNKSPWLIAYAVIGPLTHAALALGLAWAVKLSVGDATLLMVLAGSASYIAVPAVLQHAVPEANPSLYLGLSLGITFPLNIIFGIPLYLYIARMVLG